MPASQKRAKSHDFAGGGREWVVGAGGDRSIRSVRSVSASSSQACVGGFGDLGQVTAAQVGEGHVERRPVARRTLRDGRRARRPEAGFVAGIRVGPSGLEVDDLPLCSVP